MDTTRAVSRFLLALLALAAVAYVAGGERVLSALSTADPTLLAYAIGSSVVSLACFMQVFAGSATVVLPRRRRVHHTYLVGLFVRGVLPWGNVASATMKNRR